MRLSNIEARKGVSPVIATMMLIAITTVAIGAVYSFTQGKSQALRGETAPRAKITLQKAYKLDPPIYCSHTDGVVLKHVGGETLKVNKLKFVFTTQSQPGAEIYEPPQDWEWNPGEILGLSDFDHADYIYMALPIRTKCKKEDNNNYAHGSSVNLHAGEKMTVRVIHKPSDKVIFEGSIEAQRTIERYR